MSVPASAHQLGMALLQLSASDSSATQWQLHSEIPLAGGRQTANIRLQTPVDCQLEVHSLGRVDGRALSQTYYRCTQSWLGQRLHVIGLDPQTPDALIQVNGLDRQTQFYSITRQQPYFTLRTGSKPAQVSQYLGLGLAHIASGLDHLLFICLLCFCCSGARLLWTVTGFTLAHAISLSSILIGGWKVAPAPVESLIAISIALLAAELLRRQRSANFKLSFTLRYPAIMAFGFGLLHGLGFATALREIGLPAQAQWQALLLFNVGIELGQLILIALLLSGLWLLGQIAAGRLKPLLNRLQAPLLYGIGVIGMLWAWQRMAMI